MVGSDLAAEIRNRIFEKLGLTTSGGISHNKLLSKLAGAIHKPNQQVFKVVNRFYWVLTGYQQVFKVVNRESTGFNRVSKGF